MEYIYERVGSKHYKDLAFLFEHCFNRNVGATYFEKKFRTKNLGIEHIGYMAYTPEGFPAAYYGLYPVKISYNNQDYIAAVSADTMTHTTHKRRGLFDLLSRKTFVLAKEEGIVLLYCFPNQLTLPGSYKLGWQYTEEEKMIHFSEKVYTLPLAKIARKNKLINKLYESYVAFIFRFYKKGVKHFENTLNGKDYAFIVHDDHYYSYKKYTKNHIINISGCNIWLKVDGELKIGDMQINEDIDFNHVLKKLKFLSFIIGNREIQTTTSKESAIHHAFSKRQKGAETFCVGRIDMGLNFEKEKVKFVMADFDSF